MRKGLKTPRRPGVPAPVPTWKALAERSTDSGGIVLDATIGRDTNLSQEQQMSARYFRLVGQDIDLAAGGPHWRTQKRDGHGRFTSTGGGLASKAVPALKSISNEEKIANAAKMYGGDSREHEKAVLRFGTPEEKKALIKQQINRPAAARLPEVAVESPEQVAADPRFKSMTITPEGALEATGHKDNPKSKNEVWRATPEEREAMLADNEDDPLDGKTEAELLSMLDSDNEADRKAALASFEARRKRLELLAEAARTSVDAKHVQESLGKWDSRMSKVPGGKAVVKWKNRLAKEENVERVKEGKKEAGHYAKHFLLHGAVGSALVGLSALAAGYASIKYGGDPEAIEHAKHAMEHWLHGGPKIGLIPANEIIAWLGIQGAIGVIGKKAGLLGKRRRAKKAAATAGADLATAYPNPKPKQFKPPRPKKPGTSFAAPGGKSFQGPQPGGTSFQGPRPRKPRQSVYGGKKAPLANRRLAAKGVVRAARQKRMLGSI